MASVAKTVEDLLRPTADEMGYTIWDTEYKKEGGGYILRIYIDKEDGISIDDCERFSKAVDPVLDAKDPVPDSYCLEVSSAGLDRALTRQEHFQAYIGKEVDVGLYKNSDGKKSFTGELVSHDETATVVRIDNKDITFNNKDISSVKLTVVF